jgi:hypothetical protein
LIRKPLKVKSCREFGQDLTRKKGFKPSKGYGQISEVDFSTLATSPTKPQSKLTFSFDDYGKKGSIMTGITGAAVIAIILPAHGNLLPTF